MVHLRIVCKEYWQWISIYNLCLFYHKTVKPALIVIFQQHLPDCQTEIVSTKICNTNIHLLPKTFLWQMLMIDFKCEWYSRIYQILAVQFVFKYKKWPSERRWYTPTCVTPGVTKTGFSISIQLASINISIDWLIDGWKWLQMGNGCNGCKWIQKGSKWMQMEVDESISVSET